MRCLSVLETGEPLDIDRKGRLLRVVADQRPSKLSNVKVRNAIVGRPETFDLEQPRDR
jgi:hypothetical protein